MARRGLVGTIILGRAVVVVATIRVVRRVREAVRRVEAYGFTTVVMVVG